MSPVVTRVFRVKGKFNMNLFDILIIIILVFCLIRGLFRGLVLEISSIIGVLGGLYAASIYYPAAAAGLSKWITDAAYLNIISIILVFLTIFISISILGKLIKMLLKIAFMGWFDRIFGAGFGAMKGFLIASVLLFTFTTFLPRGSSFVKNSKLSPYVSTVSEQMSRLVPNGLHQSFTSKVKGLKKVWKNHN